MKAEEYFDEWLEIQPKGYIPSITDFAEAYHKSKVEATNSPEEDDNVEYTTEEVENEAIMWNLAYKTGWNDCKEQLLKQ